MARKTNAELVAELRDAIKRASPYTLWPDADLEPEERVAFEGRLKEQFERWRDSWIAPLVDEIERRLARR